MRSEVDVAEQVFVHVGVIAARVEGADRVVFVQVVGRDVLERERTRAMALRPARRRRPWGSSRSASPGRHARARGALARSLRRARRRRPGTRPAASGKTRTSAPEALERVGGHHRHQTPRRSVVKAGRRLESRSAQPLRSWRRPRANSPTSPGSSWPLKMPSAIWIGSAGHAAAARGS